MSATTRKRAKSDIERQCRACLMEIDGPGFIDIFLPWDQIGMGFSIAEGLTKLTSVQIYNTDPYPKYICLKCCSCLKDAYNFMCNVKKSDSILRKKYNESKIDTPSWPKPIQVDKNIISSALGNDMQVEIKQEVVTDDENEMSEAFEPCEPRLDIKIEPEEMMPAQIEMELNDELRDAIHAPETDDDSHQTNGDTEYLNELKLDVVKDEPISEDETETDIFKECMLCMKTFSTLKGLKAHVIAIHSYESVTSHRVVDNTNVCNTCNQSFATRTDLYVHETCHSKFMCYVCDKRLNSFSMLIKHRIKCKKNSPLPRLKTLEDVRRPVNNILDQATAPQEGSTIHYKNIKSLDEPDNISTFDKNTTSKEQLVEYSKKNEGYKIPQESNNTSQIGTQTNSILNEPVCKSNLRFKNINYLQKPNYDRDNVDINGDKVGAGSMKKMLKISDHKESVVRNQTDDNQPPHSQTELSCADEVPYDNAEQVTETSGDITEVIKITYCVDTVNSENKKMKEKKTICSKEETENKSRKNDKTEEQNIQNPPKSENNCNEFSITSTDNNTKINKNLQKIAKPTKEDFKISIDKKEEHSKMYINADENGADRKRFKTSANNTDETDSEQTAFQNDEYKSLENCERPDMKIGNIDSNEGPKLNTLGSNIMESMEVQLEIHSMSHDSDTMEVDAEINTHVKMDSSGSTK